jgi:hypothetical protein
LTKILGDHTVKAGGVCAVPPEHDYLGNSAGTYNFTAGCAPSSASTTVAMGQDMAHLYGLPSEGLFDINTLAH